MAKKQSPTSSDSILPELLAAVKDIVVQHLELESKRGATFVQLARVIREQVQPGDLDITDDQINAIIDQLVAGGSIAYNFMGDNHYHAKLEMLENIIIMYLERQPGASVRRLEKFIADPDLYWFDELHDVTIEQIESAFERLVASGAIVQDGKGYVLAGYIPFTAGESENIDGKIKFNGVDLYKPECDAMIDLENMMYHDIMPATFIRSNVRQGEGNSFDAVDGHVTSLQILQKEVEGEPNQGYIEFETLPESIGNLVHLERMIIAENRIASLPESFGNLAALKDLILYGNQLSSLPESFGNLVNLEKLNLSENQLASLPNSFGNLSNLKDLDISKNDLEEFPVAITRITSLQKLTIADNQILALPEEIGNLGNLKELDVSRNPLVSLPDEICNLESLENLYADVYQMTSIPDAVRNLMSQIERLHLERLRLEGRLKKS